MPTPCTERQPMRKGEALLFPPTMSFLSVWAGVRVSVLSLPAHAQAVWINVFPSLKPIPLLLNILIFSHAHTHHTLHGVSACRPSFSLFLYWSLCPHSWCQSCFLQVHFKGIQPLVFHSQENNTESLLCTCSIDSLSWLNFTASQKF